MVVQAIALLDDLDKEINIYAMRIKVYYLIFRLPGQLFTILWVRRNGMAGTFRKWPK
jgi:hypothetical protein